MRSILVLSPPGIGKTTILRDLSRSLSRDTRKNILICDERGEISAGNTGDTSDVLLFADKATAFEAGIRAMRPDIMITDELSPADCSAVEPGNFRRRQGDRFRTFCRDCRRQAAVCRNVRALCAAANGRDRQNQGEFTTKI